MAAPILIAERYPGVVMMAAPFAIRQASRLRKPIPSVREQRFVAGYVWKQPVKSLVFHGYTPQYRFFVGHSCTHSCDPPEVAVETFNPIGGIDHGLYLWGVVQVGHVSLVDGIATHELEGPVVFSPPLTHLLPFLPCLLNGVIALSGTEYIPQICS